MITRRLRAAGWTVLVVAIASLGVRSPALAHHDWSAYDTSKTVFLSGSVSDVSWQNPHADVQLEVPPGVGVPDDLAEADISKKLEEIGGRQSLERATVPGGAAGEWTVEMESPSFMQGVGMDDPPGVGEPLWAVGFLSRQDPRTLRVELVVLADGRTLSVRNSAVATLPTGVVATGGTASEEDVGNDDAQPKNAPAGQGAGAVEDSGGSGNFVEAESQPASWTERIEANPLSELLRSSRWGYPVSEIAHLLGLAALVGAAALFDLRLLGFWRGLPVTDAARHLMRVVWMGFVLTVATGALMFVTDATELVSNPAFRLKMALIFVAGCNAAAFHIGTFGSVAKWDANKSTPAGAKFAAVVSLLVWAGVVACGRLIAYV